MNARLLESAIAESFTTARGRLPDSSELDPLLNRVVARELAGQRGARVLDLGCGKGRFFDVWRNIGLDVVGIDRCGAMLRDAQYEYAKGNANVSLSHRESSENSAPPKLVQGTARELPFADESFDVVCAVEVLSHLPEPKETLAEVHRVLRPGGRLIVVDKNLAALNPRRPYLPESLVKWIDQRRGLWMYPPGFPYRERWYWRPALIRLLAPYFQSMAWRYVLSPEERQSAGRGVFARIPAARRLLLVRGMKRSRRHARCCPGNQAASDPADNLS